MLNDLKSRIKQAVPLKARQSVIILFWGAFSMWESYAYYNLQDPLRGTLQEDSISYFLLYHIGDLNNTFMLALGIYLFMTMFCKKLWLNFMLSFGIVLSIFLSIEWNDQLDIPFAVIGLLLFAFFVEQPKFKSSP